ncbi:lactonase family protein [Paenibacillus sanguinis]|uniref:lactonase family protein n=1 Tax=Paenibacillus sanguinis TaxID=225906 RepID=UPI0003735F34|nr:lactonase family protein [Paenibacillus sanguinis]
MNKEKVEVLRFYVGTYAEKSEPGIYLCELELRSGKIRKLREQAGIANPSFLIADAKARRLYAVSERSDGQVAGYAVDPQEGSLTMLGTTASTEGADPCHLALRRGAERHLLAANYSSGDINVFALDSGGAPGEMTSRVRHQGSSVNAERQESAHAHSAVPSPDGRFAFVSDLGMDQVIIYRLEGGRLERHGEVHLPPGAGPRHFVIHPSQRFAYGINELNNSLTTYTFDSERGHLEVVQHIHSLPEDYTGENYPADIQLSPDGRFVYGSNRGHDSVVGFRIHPDTGHLYDPSWTAAGGNWPRNFAMLANYALVANQYSDNIAVLRRDELTGRLELTGQSLAISKPSCIALWDENGIFNFLHKKV